MLEKKHIKSLKKLIGDDNVKDDEARLIAYCYDATRDRFRPDCVVFPKHEQDVSLILKYCNDNKIIIVPRGAGSGFTGGALPSSGGIVISLEKHMTKIKEIDMQNMVAVVEPGVINSDLQKTVEQKGLFYPPDPASQDYSTIGGNVSENAGGMRAAKYGITKDYVMALRAVLPNGDIIRAGKRTIKDVAGYNIAGILIASEGTLAIITEITLKLIPKPKTKKSAFGIFDSTITAMNAVYKSMASGVTPVAMEFLDNLTIKAVEEKFNRGLDTTAGAMLISEVDGNSDKELQYQLDILEKSFVENGCKKFVVAQDNIQSDNLWFARKNASQSLSIYGNKKINEDITVPRSCLPELLKEIEMIGKKYSLNIPCFGHTGDGNVHVNVMIKNKDDKKQLEIGHQAIKEIFQITIDLGGTLSGEHGIGISKAPFMSMAFTKQELELFRTIKKAFDPNNILNPNKMGL